MFNNPGEKLQKWSKIIFRVGVALAVIVGCYYLLTIYEKAKSNIDVFKGIDFWGSIEIDLLVVMVIFVTLTIIASYVIGLLLYGLGTLVQNRQKNEEGLNEIKENQQKLLVFLQERNQKIEQEGKE